MDIDVIGAGAGGAAGEVDAPHDVIVDVAVGDRHVVDRAIDV